MVGHKLGEFSPTRKFNGHTPADKKAAAEAPSINKDAPKAASAAAKPATPIQKGKEDGKK